MKNTSLKFLLPILITSFIGLITFIYLSGQAQSKESVSNVKDIATQANMKADTALNKVTELKGDLNTLDEKLSGKVENMGTNIEWIREAMTDNGIKPRIKTR